MSEQKLTFKQFNISTPPKGSCPYTGQPSYEGAQLVRKCSLLPDLVSCTYWQNPETFNLCPTRKAEEEQCNLHL